jgi:hypothetical protein
LNLRIRRTYQREEQRQQRICAMRSHGDHPSLFG